MRILSSAVPVTMFVFVVSSMLAVGLSLTVGQIVAPLRNGKLVALALLGNFVLMPLGAFVVARLLWLDEPLRVALLLLSMAAGAPFLPMLAGIAKGNLAFAVGLMVLLMVVTVGYMPLLLPLLLKGVSVDPTKIARSLVLLMLLPLALGLGVKARYALAAARVRAFLDRGLHPEPRLPDGPDRCGEPQQPGGVVRHARHPGEYPLSMRGGRYRLVSRRASPRYQGSDGTGHRAAKYPGRAGGRRAKLRRPEGGRHGGRGRGCWPARPVPIGAGVGRA